MCRPNGISFAEMAADYISFPTHKIEEGEVESNDDGLIDGDEASDDAMGIKLPKTKRGRG